MCVMKLSDHDLLQLDEEYLSSLPSDALLSVSRKLLLDLKESREVIIQRPNRQLGIGAGNGGTGFPFLRSSMTLAR